VEIGSQKTAVVFESWASYYRYGLKRSQVALDWLDINMV